MAKAVRLHDYQNDIKLRLCEAWQNHRAVMVQMPTGTGKTHVLAAVVKDFLSADEGAVWIVAHRRELVAQIEETVGRYGISWEDGRVRVLSIQWLSRHWEDGEGKPKLVIIDEAHHAVAETYRELWSRFPDARFLGLTATPCRMNSRGFTDLFDTLVTSWSIAEFIGKGYLSTFDYVSIRQGSEEQRLIDSLEKRGADGDYQIKEMDSLLNRHTSIERLYSSMMRFAGGKKGIVYAISINHARKIAEYYSSHGVNAVPIDSRTPVEERKRMVKEFRAGRIQVLVNVDIFSEGFDCPDVEFVQMARPTLSLAKYLQQVGRGLRKTEGKEACVLIDNVGLYRVFGLPTVAWDWEAMFRGEESGKGMRLAAKPGSGTALAAMRKESGMTDCEMEVVVSHDRLLSFLAEQKEQRLAQVQRIAELKAWQDAESGLWGLRRGRTKTTEARFVTVFDIRYDLAAVRLPDKRCCLVDNSGTVVWKKGGCHSVKFLNNHFLHVRTSGGQERFIDLHSLRMYDDRPEIRRYGNIELLKVGRAYYSRTKTVYESRQNICSSHISRHAFYLSIPDSRLSPLCCREEPFPYACYSGYICLLDGDYEDYYWLCCRLPDGSIVVRDREGAFYHVEEGRVKRRLGRGEAGTDGCRTEIEHLARRARENMLRLESEKRRRRWDESHDAMPFRSGMKWGLKAGNRIVVPPIYRHVKPPVGRYCAVEKNYSQWGIMALDGTLLVDPNYREVSIGENGTALLTSVTGKQVSVKLP